MYEGRMRIQRKSLTTYFLAVTYTSKFENSTQSVIMNQLIAIQNLIGLIIVLVGEIIILGEDKGLVMA